MATKSEGDKSASVTWRGVFLVFSAIWVFAFGMSISNEVNKCTEMCEAKGGELESFKHSVCLCRDSEGVFTPYRIKE